MDERFAVRLKEMLAQTEVPPALLWACSTY